MENGHKWSWKVLEMHKKRPGNLWKNTFSSLYAPCITDIIIIIIIFAVVRLLS